MRLEYRAPEAKAGAQRADGKLLTIGRVKRECREEFHWQELFCGLCC